MAASSETLNFKEAKKYACDRLGVAELKKQQSDAIDALLAGKDVFVCLPTGFGKSLIFQAAPLCHDALNKFSFNSLAVIVVPLKSLALNQIERLQSRGIKSCMAIGEFTEEVLEESARGEYSLVFSSPEALFSPRGREFLQLNSVQKQLCGLFIDESHCVTKWGQSSKKTVAFRKMYGEIGQLRSLLKPGTVVVALTATASTSVQTAVADALQMRTTVLVHESPVCNNIKHAVLNTKLQDAEVIFTWLAEELSKRQQKMERVIVYCISRKMCAELYSIFCFNVPAAHHKFFEMYHTNTESDIQEMIIQSFSDPDGVVRLLFATIAFGLGVDVKGVHSVVIFGAPSDIDDYIQLSGRAGRDGKQSLSIIVNYPVHRGTPLQQQMKDFLTTTQCRRDKMHAAFPVAHTQGQQIVAHDCCDNCAANCHCGGLSCSASPSFVEDSLRKQLSTVTVDSEVMTRTVSEEEYTSVQEDLEELRKELMGSSTHVYAGHDVACGLSADMIVKLLDEISFSFTHSQFCHRYVFGSNQIRERVWGILNSDLVSSVQSGIACVDERDSSEDELDDFAASEAEYAEPCIVYSDTDGSD